jgi:tetratricopeptide (TPR) repeat protein
VLVTEPFHDDAVNDRATRTRASVARAQRAAELVRARKPQTPDEVAAVLRDRRGPGGSGLPLGHRAAVDDLGGVHTAIFDPSTLTLWVTDDAHAGARMRGFDLRHELRGEGDAAAPPPDIAMEADFDEGRAEAVRAARRELVLGARARTRDALGRAREHAERALSLAPDLPAAHRLAGELAREAGDRDRARRHFTRYLELGPDDAGAEPQIRAYLGQ